jgi:maleylpyruvate isomerase
MGSESGRSPVPTEWISGCTESHARLHAIARGVTDQTARRPTLLEGWTVGHLLTHLARNADSNRGIIEAAQRGEVVPQYPGGPAQRNGDIERGYVRSAQELTADVKAANQQLEHAWSTTDNRVWTTGLGLRRYGPATLAEFVFLRWREVEIHLVDLNLPELGSPDWNGLNSEYVDAELQELARGLAARIPGSMTLVLAPGDRPSRAFGKGNDHVVIEGSPSTIVAWLMGRVEDPSWPTILPWE